MKARANTFGSPLGPSIETRSILNQNVRTTLGSTRPRFKPCVLARQDEDRIALGGEIVNRFGRPCLDEFASCDQGRYRSEGTSDRSLCKKYFAATPQEIKRESKFSCLPDCS